MDESRFEGGQVGARWSEKPRGLQGPEGTQVCRGGTGSQWLFILGQQGTNFPAKHSLVDRLGVGGGI